MLPTAPNLHSIGKQLMAARVERGLSVEDIAFKTHIPANRVKELENDDFSNFANLTYAKGFLKIYSNYLDLDLSEYLDQFNTSEFANISGHDYIQSANTGLTSLSMAVAPPSNQGRGSTMIGIVLLVITAIGLPIWYWSKPRETVAPEPEELPVRKPRIIEDPKPTDAEPPPAGTSAPAPGSTNPIPDGVSPVAATLPTTEGPPKVKRTPEIRAATPVLKALDEPGDAATSPTPPETATPPVARIIPEDADTTPGAAPTVPTSPARESNP